MLKLYNSAFSTCSQKVRLCLAEKNLDWVDRQINFADGDHLAPDYLKINSNGVVPTLVHDGVAIVESQVICEYLNEVFLELGTNLVPEEPQQRAQMRSWLYYISEVPTSAIRYPSFNSLFRKYISENNTEEFRQKLPLRKSLYRKFGQDGFSEQEIKESYEALRQTVERIDTATKNAVWLLGEQFTLADICVLPTIVRMQDISLDHLWGGLKNFQNWFDRMQRRPSFSTAFYPGSRLTISEHQGLEAQMHPLCGLTR